MIGESAATLDLRGLRCPLPVLRVRKALAGLAPGERIFARVDDPLAGVDIPHFLRETGHTLVTTETDGGEFLFVIEKAAPKPLESAPSPL
ncbi:transcriptional regulator [Methylopila jiangsuensis]|uniref:Transcriptional regulator n=1 Tax=Methylopila jiangsuensis TaxID=586230 RepID=A0A9W6N333_9HYPH|nr:sulfurtransferase TusA family protein [Methylopila jiangsuensis]MDR6285900.1 tRNA 2-thiouridine synthesizing protein A [Methylopila jiangsuensis]GLK75657.1 transcriptional regulator [Methylopila jiangsuensis]